MIISYSMLGRYLERSDELAGDAELPPLLKSFHAARLVAPTAAFRTAHVALVAAESAASKERGEVKKALESIAQPYRFVRALVTGHAPDFVLPEALGSLATDTDKKLALEALLHRIDASAGEAWADELAQSEFAKRAPDVIREIEEDAAARTALSRAIETRAATFGPAYEAFMAFRAAVRAGCGPTSRLYRRIAPASTRARADEAGSPTPA